MEEARRRRRPRDIAGGVFPSSARFAQAGLVQTWLGEKDTEEGVRPRSWAWGRCPWRCVLPPSSKLEMDGGSGTVATGPASTRPRGIMDVWGRVVPSAGGDPGLHPLHATSSALPTTTTRNVSRHGECPLGAKPPVTGALLSHGDLIKLPDFSSLSFYPVSVPTRPPFLNFSPLRRASQGACSFLHPVLPGLLRPPHPGSPRPGLMSRPTTDHLSWEDCHKQYLNDPSSPTTHSLKK